MKMMTGEMIQKKMLQTNNLMKIKQQKDIFKSDARKVKILKKVSKSINQKQSQISNLDGIEAIQGDK